MSLKDSLKMDIRTYSSAPDYNLGDLLRILVRKHSTAIYSDPARLREELSGMGVSEGDILRIALMAQMPDLRQLVASSRKTVQADLDVFVRRAVQFTGLSRETVMDLTGAIALSVDIAFSYTSRPSTTPALSESAFVVPMRFYQKELDAFQKEFTKAVETRSLSALNLDKLSPLVAVGLPKAKYFLGYYLLHTSEPEQTNERAVALLEEAAAQGDAAASAELGDYYYQHNAETWGLAYEYYTGYGASALNTQRKQAVSNILNQRQYNRKVLGLSAVLFLFMCATLVFAPGAAVFPPCYFAGGISAFCNLAVLTLAALRYRAKPYGYFTIVPVCMFAIWSLHVAVRLLL